MSKAQQTKRKDMPKVEDVRAFWAYKLLALGKITDTEDALDPIVHGWGRTTALEVARFHAQGIMVPAHDDPVRKEPVLEVWQCFCCGRAGPLDRAHISALTHGGSNHVSNIHMLCRPCHTESEPYQGETYWRWFLTKPHRCSWHPNHFAHIWPAMGERDVEHAVEMALVRSGQDEGAALAEIKRLVRETYHPST